MEFAVCYGHNGLDLARSIFLDVTAFFALMAPMAMAPIATEPSARAPMAPDPIAPVPRAPAPSARAFAALQQDALLSVGFVPSVSSGSPSCGAACSFFTVFSFT